MESRSQQGQLKPMLEDVKAITANALFDYVDTDRCARAILISCLPTCPPPRLSTVA